MTEEGSKPRWRWLPPAAPADSWDVAPAVPARRDVGALLAPGGALAAEFELLGTLGAGGHATVFRVRERASGRELALKLLRRLAGPTERARALREARLTGALDHPGVVRVASVGEAEGHPYLLTELVPGAQTLDQAWQDLGREERLAQLQEVADALAHAHGRGVVHRDLKPTNVLVDDAGRVRVVDFGMAWAEDEARLTRSGALLGTPLYMAPEQFNSSQVGPSADVWALGLLLYEALLDRRPFEADTLAELASRVRVGRFDRPRSLDRSVSPALEAVVLHALEADPARRLADGEAFARALREARAGRRTLAARRSPALALATLLVAAVGGWALTRPAPRPDLGAALAARERGELETAALEAALLATPDDPARGRAHLVLARDPALPLAARRVHAARAATDPALGEAAARAQVDLELEAGDPRAAAAAAAAAWDALPPPTRLEVATQLDALGASSAAAELLAGEPAREARLLRARAAVAAGDAALALDLATDLARERLDSASAGLELWARAAGAGPCWPRASELRASVPDDAELRAAWVLLRVTRGELRVAQRIAPDRASAEALQRVLASQDVAELPRLWRQGVARACGVEARRLRLLTARTADPGGWSPPRKDLARQDRARAWIAAGLALEPDLERARRLAGEAALTTPEALAPRALAAALAPPWDDPALARAAARRALDAGALDEAARALDAARALAPLPDPQHLELEVELALARDDAPAAERARAAAARVRDADAAGAEAALDAFLSSRGSRKPPRAELDAAYARVLALDPRHAPTLLRQSSTAFRYSGDPADLAPAVAAAERYPGGLHHLLESVLSLTATGLGHDGVLLDYAARAAAGSRERALLLARAAELEGAPPGPALEALDAWIAAAPANALPRVLRGALWLRLDELAAAEVDLELAGEASPRSASVAFLQARVLARQGAGRSAVIAALRRAETRGFSEWELPTWDLARYPELEPYAESKTGPKLGR